MKILITNDDGIHAPGLRALWRAASKVGEVTIVAPSVEQSGSGMGVTFDRQIELRSHAFEEGVAAWTVSGTPSDCVRMALQLVLKERPDLVLSGVNAGGNAGRNLFYSGTIGAAMEAVLCGIPSIAFSCHYSESVAPIFETAERLIPDFLRFHLDHPLPPSTLLNVNFPPLLDPKGVQIARQGRGFWGVRTLPTGDGRYWLPGNHVSVEEPDASDVALLDAGYVTAVPIDLAELTHHTHRLHLIDRIKDYF